MDMYRWTQHRVFDDVGSDRQGPTVVLIWDVVLAAVEETLQGAPLQPAFLQLFSTQLSSKDPTWLRWRGDLAESAELRRAYSGLYGRFFARALLTRHLQLTRFQSLNRDRTDVGTLTIKRISDGDIPDWIAWDARRGRHVLCEAKGSMTARDFLSPGVPACVAAGKAQFARVEVRDGGVEVNPGKWVAATRWATDGRPGKPVTILWDPPGNEEPYDSEATRRHRNDMTRAWLNSLAPAFGCRNADELLSPERRFEAVRIRADPGRRHPSGDWPSGAPDDTAADDSTSAQVGRLSSDEVRDTGDTDLSQAILEDDLGGSAVYAATSVPRPPAGEKSPFEGDFLTVMITRFGVRPVRTLDDLIVVTRAQKRARALEEPALLACLPFGLDADDPPAEGEWLDEAGIFRSGGLGVCDLRSIEISWAELDAL